MEIKRKITFIKITFMTSIGFLFALLFLTTPTSAYEAGKTYDKTNYQEIKDLLAPCILFVVENGDYSLKTSKLDHPIKIKDDYKKLSEANEEKYDFSETGNLIAKDTGQPPGFIRGDPFDKIDPKDPKVAQKIMEKFYFNIRCRHGSNSSGSITAWLGQSGGIERQVKARGMYFNYTNMPRGPLPNPNDFRSQSINYVEEPFDVRGTTAMSWEYNTDKESTAFAYVPMLRRVRRTSAAARSDPFMGSDSCTDDSYGYAGKNADMTFKYIGAKEVLIPFTTDKIITTSHFEPGGGFMRTFPAVTVGFEDPNNKYASYNPTSLRWILSPVYIVEMNAKNEYYAYGKQILYIEQTQFWIPIKEVYDRAGVYWKKILTPCSYHLTSDGTDLVMSDVYLAQDDKTRHATFSWVRNPYGADKPMINRPYEDLGPHTFTMDAIIQLSK